MTVLRHPSAATSIIVALCSSLLVTAPVRADGTANPAGDAQTTAEARTHFQRGVRLGEMGSYREAAIEFEAAYRLAPHFAVLFNLGQAYVALARPVDAVEVLRRYLTEGGSALPPSRRSEVQAIIRQQEGRISTVTVEANVDGAVLLIDGVTVGRSPLPAPVRVARGAHQFTAVLEGYRATPRTVDIGGEDNVRVSMRLEREPMAGARASAGAVVPPAGIGTPPQPPAPSGASPPIASLPTTPAAAATTTLPLLSTTPETEQPPESDPRRLRTIGFVVGAVGLVVGGVALGHFLWNKGRYDAYQEAMVNDPDKAASIRRASGVTVGLAVGAGALLSTGVVLVTW